MPYRVMFLFSATCRWLLLIQQVVKSANNVNGAISETTTQFSNCLIAICGLLAYSSQSLERSSGSTEGA